MPQHKRRAKSGAARPTSLGSKASRRSKSAVGTTVSAPSHPDPATSTAMAVHAEEQEALAAGMPFNTAKPNEFGAAHASAHVEGMHKGMPSPTTGAGTLSEKNESPKTGHSGARASIAHTLPTGEADPGLLIEAQGDSYASPEAFIRAVGKHRHPARDQDPPRV